jgi:hypothetical protein
MRSEDPGTDSEERRARMPEPYPWGARLDTRPGRRFGARECLSLTHGRGLCLLRDAPEFGLAVEAAAVDAAGSYDGLRRVIRRPRGTRAGA